MAASLRVTDYKRRTTKHVSVSWRHRVDRKNNQVWQLQLASELASKSSLRPLVYLLVRSGPLSLVVLLCQSLSFIHVGPSFHISLCRPNILDVRQIIHLRQKLGAAVDSGGPHLVFRRVRYQISVIWRSGEADCH